MLSTRLAARENMRVLDYALSKKEFDDIQSGKKKAPQQGLFRSLHADYIATGVLTAHGEGVSLQMTFYSAAAASKTQTFVMSADKEDAVMSSLDRLTADIDSRLSGSSPGGNAPAEVANTVSQAQNTVANDQMAAFRTPNPERAYKTGIYAGGSIIGAENSGMPVSSQGVRKSTPLSMKMVGMAMGDLEGNGQREIVAAGDEELRIFQFNEGRFQQVAKLQISPRLKIHAVNVADVDKSGRSLIYISATEEKTISSLVLSWDKAHGLQTIHKNVRWYLRPMAIPHDGVVLVGQQKGPDENILAFPGLYELTFSKGNDVPKQGKQISVPKSVNLFDFSLADLNGDGKIEKIVIDKNEKMSVYDEANSLLWTSEENFGGSPNYLGPGWTNLGPSDDRIFVPTRIIAVDIDHDKKQEIIVGRNKRSSYSFFRNLRTYDDGYVSCMTWTGTAMAELWHTNTLSGMVADYSLQSVLVSGGNPYGAQPADAEKKESLTVFIGQIPEAAIYNVLVSASPETILYAYNVDIVQKNDKTKELR
ncbi:MAG: VCBS repeat-containing protein [Desulfocapsaceae bacterium]|nr:VCBS repeat-containing protein [Desulfocapsaceae bacterium]